ncbi:MAG: PD40 domain-containing protein [Flavobacteriales bacterium]|nr:PD40 domain-containing protein [Flavobacteriales bacterium]
MTRSAAILFGLLCGMVGSAQGGAAQLRAKADGLFAEKHYAEALPLYSQLVSLEPSDRILNYHYGTCVLFGGGADREKAIGFLKYASEDPAIPAPVWYWLGRAYHLNYRFNEALNTYQRFRGTGDKKAIAELPVDALEQQCRNGQQLLSSLKDISVHSKVEVEGREFFRYYDLEGIGGRIVVTPEELKTSLDKKSSDRQLIYLPDKPGPIYFSSYGKDGKNGRDIYRTELLPTGAFAEPTRLAGFINTDQDEDFAFIHPDGKSFYFASKGHNSMGGFDVFKSTYDRGMDVFGRPENMDFAVNTPDDDLFYIVDGEGKQACFASARSSSQGMLHVFRVSTEQVPVVLTVLKGTFASAFDAEDRKAHIVVEDALTREVVGDVRTDMNGTYMLSLPRSGRYRFLVEAGPSGRTHAGIVEVPRSDGPRAYRQELVLENQAGQERLMIKNYFDEPLEGDLITMALEEIKRRARLEVGNAAAAPPVVAQEAAPTKDELLAKAGFTGDLTTADVVHQLEEEGSKATTEAEDLRTGSGAAYTVALEQAAVADTEARAAAELVARANTTSDPAEKERTMRDAAAARQRSRVANLKARAAMEAGEDLDSERAATRQRGERAAKLATDLAGALSSTDTKSTLPLLVQARERIEASKGPASAPDLQERARRAAAEKELEAARTLAAASGRSAEEGELTDRIVRLKREQEESKSKSKKDDLQREITGLEEQLGFLRQEVAQAFTKARVAEREVTMLKAKAGLVGELQEQPGAKPATELDATAITSLGERIAGNEVAIGHLAIDQRYEAELNTTAADLARMSYDWDLADAGRAVGERSSATEVVAEQGGVQSTVGRTISATERGVEIAAPVTVPERDGVRTGGEVAPGTDGAGGTDPSLVAATSPAAITDPKSNDPANGSTQSDQGQVSPADPQRNNTAAEPQSQLPPTSGAASNTGTGTVTVDRPVLTPEQVREEAEPVPVQEPAAVPAITYEEQRFVLENQLAELTQLLTATRDKDERARIDARIVEVNKEIFALDLARPAVEVPVTASAVDSTVIASSNEKGNATPTDGGPVLQFYASVPGPVLSEQLYPGYAADVERLNTIADLDERIASLTGAELMLIDSIDAQTQRQLAVVEADATRAAEVLPRVERLRTLKLEHQQRIESLKQEASRTIVLAEEAPQDRAPATPSHYPGMGTGSYDDHYVDIPEDPTRVYESRLEHRASTVSEAVGLMNKDLADMEVLTRRIDSMEQVLDTMLYGKARDKLLKSTDKLIDDRMIIRSDLGQRTAFITREELEQGRDSLKVLGVEVARKGFAPNEPVLALARAAEENSKRHAGDAERLRKLADRSEDILARDSLFRLAYTIELQALAEIDRAITANAYLLSSDLVRGESLTMEQVQQRVLGPTMPATAEPMAGTEGASEKMVPSVSAAQEMGTTTTAVVVVADSVLLVTEAVGMGADTSSAGTTEPFVARSLDPAGQPRYDSFLMNDADGMGAMSALAKEDPVLLDRTMKETAQRAEQQEASSVELADRAVALRDSATTAKRKDREELAKEAVLLQSISDSLHTASLRTAEEARALEQHQRDVVEARAFAERLRAFYYLSGQEHQLVMDNEDHSRYFQAKVKSLQQVEAAASAGEEAVSTRQLADALKVQAEQLASSAEATTASGRERMESMNARAIQLGQRSDSLSAVAQRLKGASALNDGQAALYLQGMENERASEIMALEQRARRVEPMLAEARSVVPAGSTVADRTTAAPVHATGADSVGTAGTAQDAVPTAPTNEPVVALQTPATPPTSNGASDGSTGPLVTPATTAAAVPGTTQPVGSGVEPVPAEPTVVSPAQVLASDNAPIVPERTVERTGLERLEPLRNDVFAVMNNPVPRAEPIPIEAPMPTGLVFKVQIGAFRDPVPQQLFNDLSPVTGERTANGLMRYTAGMFVNFDNADEAKASVRDRGYRDAFVVAYLDGKRITLREARDLATARAAEQAPATAQVPATTAAQPATQTPVAQPVVQPATLQEAPPVVVMQPPSAIAVVPAVSDEQVLAKYPASAQEVLAQFTPAPEAVAYYNDPSAAPARQVEVVKGLFFTVQVGVYSKPVALDKLFNITPLNSELITGGKVRYTTGIYRDMEVVRVRKDRAVQQGVKDAFVTAYLNGKRIPVAEARALIAKFGDGVMVEPALVTP